MATDRERAAIEEIERLERLGDLARMRVIGCGMIAVILYTIAGALWWIAYHA